MYRQIQFALVFLLLTTVVLAPAQLAQPASAQAPATAPLNVWNSIGPEGGKILALTINPQNANELYAAAWSGGLYKSVDGAQHWSKLRLPPDSSGANATFKHIVINPQDPRVVYAASAYQIYKTSDSGQTWTLLTDATQPPPTGLPSAELQILALAPSQPNKLYACFWKDTANGRDIYTSADGGISWVKAGELGETGCWSLIVHPNNPQVLYAGVGQHLYGSTNGGINWKILSVPFTGVVDELSTIAFSPVDANVMFVSASGGSIDTFGLYRSLDGGNTWKKINSAPIAINTLAIDPTNPAIMYSTTVQDYAEKSTDGGVTWNFLASGLPTSPILGVMLAPGNPSTVYANTFNGVYRSTDSGATWQPQNSGLAAGFIDVLAVDPYDPNYIFVGANGGVYRSSDGGTSWTLDGSSFDFGSTYTFWDRDITALAIDPSNTNTIYAGTYGKIYRSGDRGLSWQLISSDIYPNDNGFSRSQVRDLLIDPNTPTTLYMRPQDVHDGIYKSVDSGSTWTSISQTIQPSAGTTSSASFYALAMDPQNSATLYASADAGLYKTDDAGLHWIRLSNGLPESSPENTVWALAVDPVDTSTLYASVYGSLYRSRNGGESWQKVHDDINARMLLVDPTNHTTIYAGGDDGIYRSTDGGESWQSFTAGATISGVSSLAVVPASPLRIFAGTQGSGNFAMSFSISGVNVEAPRHAVAGEPFTVSVEVLGADGQRATEYSGPIALSLRGAGELNGTKEVLATSGTATFSGISIDTPNVGDQLLAAASDLSGGISPPFYVAQAQPVVSSESEPNNDAVNASPLIFDRSGNATTHGLISDSGDVDVYELSALPGAQIDIALRDLPANYDLVLLADPETSGGSGDGIDLGNVSDVGKWAIGKWAIGKWAIGKWAIGKWAIGASSNSDTTPEQLQTIVPRGGRYFIAVYSSNGAADPQHAYTLSVDLQDGTLADPVVNAQFGRGVFATRNTAKRTLFVTNFKRIDQRYAADATNRATLKSQLANAALLAASQGVILDISQGQDPAATARLDALYTRWDAAADQPLLANEVAQQIWNILDRTIETHYPNVENIVIVGGDDIIPFYRVPDDTDLGNERDYGQTLQDTHALNENTPLAGSLRYSFFQTDDFYADRKPTPWRGRQLFMPDQAIGRLVETPADIVSYLSSYIASQNYTIDTANSAALVTGYDFLSDEGKQIGETLNGFSDPGHGVIKTTQLLSDEWDLNLLNSIWFGGKLGALNGAYQGIQTPFSLSSLNSHFSHYELIPAQLAGGVFTAQRIYTPTSAIATTGYFKRNGMPTLLYSVGCHSGLSVSDSAFSDQRYQADFAQAVLKQGGNWIGNTGYGIGDSDVVGYSERLALLFTQNLGRLITDPTPTNPYIGASIGESLALAKRQYLQTTGPNGFGLFDEKVLSEMTLYGLPFIRVKVPKPRSDADQTVGFPDSVRPTLTASEGLFTRVITLTTTFAPLGDGPDTVPLIQSAEAQDTFSPTPHEPIITTSTGRDRPVLPALVYDLSLAANSQAVGVGVPEVRGVRLRSATTLPDIAGFDPHMTTPTVDQIATPPPQLTNIGQWQPALPYTFQRTARVTPGGGELVGGRPGDVTDKLIVIPAQVRAYNAQTGRLRRFSQMVFEVTYVDPRTASDAVRGQTSGPAFKRVVVVGPASHAQGIAPASIEFWASLSSTASPATQVSATYSVAGGPWQRIVLTRGSGSAYYATIAAPGSEDVSAFFEAIDRAGNVAIAAPRAGDAITENVFLALIRR